MFVGGMFIARRSEVSDSRLARLAYMPRHTSRVAQLGLVAHDNYALLISNLVICRTIRDLLGMNYECRLPDYRAIVIHNPWQYSPRKKWRIDHKMISHTSL